MFKNLVFLKDESQLKKSPRPVKNNAGKRQRLVGFDNATLSNVAVSQRRTVYHPPTPGNQWNSGMDGWPDSANETPIISPGWQESEGMPHSRLTGSYRSSGSYQSRHATSRDGLSENDKALVSYQPSFSKSPSFQSDSEIFQFGSQKPTTIASQSDGIVRADSDRAGSVKERSTADPTADIDQVPTGEQSRQSLAGSAVKSGSRQSSASASTPQSRTGSLLVGAAERGDTSAVKKLLTRPMDPDSKTKYQSRSALHLAAGYGQTAVVEQLLQAGADAGQVSQTGRTPLHEACQGGHNEVVQLLLDYTPDVDVQDKDGQTPTHLAAFNGEVDCLRILVDKDSSLVLEDRQGRQAAHLAAMRNHAAVLTFLYEAGVDLECVCDQGKLPVHYAAQHGAVESLVCLVERDCDITIGDSAGNLPLHYAASHNHVDCIRFLLKQGTAIETQNEEGRTPAHMAALHKALQALHWLLEKGAAVNATDGAFNTTAHCAAEGGKGECFHCVVRHGADLHAHNVRSETPLDTARRFGHPLLMDKAVKGQVKCPLCSQKKAHSDWQASKQPTLNSVLHSVSSLGSIAYTSPLPKLVSKPEAKPVFRQSGMQKATGKHTGSEGKSTNKSLPKRDLPTQFFGQYISDDLYKLNI